MINKLSTRALAVLVIVGAALFCVGGIAAGQDASKLASQEVVDAAITAAKAANCSQHIMFVGTIAHEDGYVKSVCGEDKDPSAYSEFAVGEKVYVVLTQGTGAVRSLVAYDASNLRFQSIFPFDGVSTVWSAKRCQFDGLKVDASQAPAVVDAGDGENPGTLSAAGLLAFIFTGERDAAGNELHVKVSAWGGCGGVAPTTTAPTTTTTAPTTTTGAPTTTTSQVTTTTAPPERGTTPSTVVRATVPAGIAPEGGGINWALLTVIVLAMAALAYVGTRKRHNFA